MGSSPFSRRACSSRVTTSLRSSRRHIIIIIGINGFKRSGKGETAKAVEAILAEYDKTVKLVGFADKLKIMAALALGYGGPDELLIDIMDEFKETGIIYFDEHPGGELPEGRLTGRGYLQNFGNEARNVFGDTFWIDQVLPTPSQHPDRESALISNDAFLARRYPDVDVLCITDLRYPNEAQRVMALGGTVWEVLRPGTASDGHVSETPLPASLVYQQVLNVGSLADLKAEVKIALGITE